MLKVKYLSGKNKDQVVELDDAKAKSLIDDELAVAVVENDPLEKAMQGLDARINEAASQAASQAAKKALDNIAKGVGNISRISVGPDREYENMSATGGFKSFNHFLYEVAKSGTDCINPTEAIKKHMLHQARVLKTAGPTGNTEGSITLTAGTGDGAVIPVQYETEIFRMYGEQDDLMSLCFPFPMNSLAAHLPVLRNYDRSNTTVTAGVVVQEQGEANVIPVSKTTWEQRIFTLVKESIMVPVSNEALDDNNVGLGSAIAAQAIWQLRKTINGGIMGTNSNTASCVGIIGGAATKIVGRATANSITFADLLNMYAAFAHGDANYNGAYWVGHPTIVNQIYSSTIGSVGALLPNGGGADVPRLTILGRPLLLSGWSKALGTTGDLTLFDPKKYIMGYKGGVNSFVSPHVYAASDQTGFRFTQRVNGQQGLTGLITLEDGSTKVSPFVTLGQVGGLS